MTRRLPLLAAWILLFGAGPCLADDAQAARVISGNEIILADGRDVRLAGIAAPLPETAELADVARSALEKLAAGKSLALENFATDRYGALAAEVYIASENGTRMWLQQDMLRQGFAFVYPPTGDEPRLAQMFSAENEARATGRGIWADAFYADTPAAKAWPKIGHFAFVSGKILKSERIKDRVYLRFGEDWRKDFTIIIAAHDLKAFRKAGVDPLGYNGKNVRVRGWVMRDGGPAMDVTTPAQIEIFSP